MVKYKSLSLKCIVLLLLFSILFPLLSACGVSGTTQSDTRSEAIDSTASTNDSAQVTLNGTGLDQYVIYFAWKNSKDEKKSADLLQTYIEKNHGISLSVLEEPLNDGAEYVIMVGKGEKYISPADPKEFGSTEYAVESDGKVIYLIGNNAYGIYKAAAHFCSILASATDSSVLSISGCEKKSYADELVSTMTYNIYNWDTSDDHLVRIKTMISETGMPDTIGFQEITKEWIDRIMADAAFASVYESIGEDRNDSTHERAAIFYRKDKFRLIDSGTRWLFGEEGSIGSEKSGKLRKSEYNRVYTYVVLERISDGTRYAHINTHLDLEQSVLAIQVAYPLAMAKQLQENEKCTVILTGDFNSTLSSDVGKLILDAGFIHTESHALSVTGSEVNDVYQGTTRKMCQGIDHIFMMSPSSFVESYTICNQKYFGGYSSDHLPRIAVFPVT